MNYQLSSTWVTEWFLPHCVSHCLTLYFALQIVATLQVISDIRTRFSLYIFFTYLSRLFGIFKTFFSINKKHVTPFSHLLPLLKNINMYGITFHFYSINSKKKEIKNSITIFLLKENKYNDSINRFFSQPDCLASLRTSGRKSRNYVFRRQFLGRSHLLIVFILEFERGGKRELLWSNLPRNLLITFSLAASFRGKFPTLVAAHSKLEPREMRCNRSACKILVVFAIDQKRSVKTTVDGWRASISIHCSGHPKY